MALRAIELGAEEDPRRILAPGDWIAIRAPPVRRGILVGAAARTDQFAGELIQRFVARDTLANPPVKKAHPARIEDPFLDLEEVRPFQRPEISELLPREKTINQARPFIHGAIGPERPDRVRRRNQP